LEVEKIFHKIAWLIEVENDNTEVDFDLQKLLVTNKLTHVNLGAKAIKKSTETFEFITPRSFSSFTRGQDGKFRMLLGFKILRGRKVRAEILDILNHEPK